MELHLCLEFCLCGRVALRTPSTHQSPVELCGSELTPSPTNCGNVVVWLKWTPSPQENCNPSSLEAKRFCAWLGIHNFHSFFIALYFLPIFGGTKLNCGVNISCPRLTLRKDFLWNSLKQGSAAGGSCNPPTTS